MFLLFDKLICGIFYVESSFLKECKYIRPVKRSMPNQLGEAILTIKAVTIYFRNCFGVKVVPLGLLIINSDKHKKS